MRGGRNKFGPMYKRDRARKLQVMRNRQVVAPVSLGGLPLGYHAGSSTPASDNRGNQPMYTPQLTIKQEIQIPQVTSMTSSPDSSPSPVQLPHGTVQLNTSNGNNGGGLSTQGQIIAQQTDPSTGGPIWQISTSPNSGSRVRTIVIDSILCASSSATINGNLYKNSAGIFFLTGRIDFNLGNIRNTDHFSKSTKKIALIIF